ncbi:MAG: L-histidine N(alpha)-methyltransferase [Ilumatobacter sp.]|uniref:L-histidine N(alpha)-methyltransferase n=1 Tax=Ilumatobacter sp. TaxID=1967498 RepID=UPI0026057001|nr:L-histidine N(alpha)-methyltransferase [Ilumatobacter sp.]MDJ0769638.1 L-histidine N(alpha)-methyltransferase [Ilumatobacter sp.]
MTVTTPHVDSVVDDVPIEPVIERHLGEHWWSMTLANEVRVGLEGRPRRLDPRWLYDHRGSELFDRITRLPEYYPTEAERSLLQRDALAIVTRAGADTLVELGSGTSDKTRTLLDALAAAGRLRRFVPVDVSEQTLHDAAVELAERYPGLAVHGVVGDFNEHLDRVPDDGTPLMAFLGSTIGNFYPPERARFLRSVAGWLRAGGTFLLGIDLMKPVDRILAAYNDQQGVTAQFSLNLLEVMNRELAADFDVSAFEHVGLWDPVHRRVDIRVRALRDQHVRIPGAGIDVDFARDEELRVEVSTKFTLEQIDAELAGAGLATIETYTSDGGDVALVLAERA